MKKLILSYSTIILFLFYVAFVNNPDYISKMTRSFEDDDDTPAFVLPATTTPSVATAAAPESAKAPPVPKKISAATPKVPVSSPIPVATAQRGQYTDGTYTGNRADAYYGNVQVQAVINQGKLVDVVFLDYPHDRDRSVRINSQATPLLKQEAIQAQNARVDGVSGATATSGAFRESLGAALSQARA